ncbi:MAG TPA: hypothetical protein VMV18_15580, partial [bacterium]|nr:hypothetical protein [bacterium]
DLPTPFRSVEELRDFHRPRVAENGGGIVSVDVYEERGMFVQETLYKFSRNPRGFTYVGALTFPFEQFSYVLKVQCPEGQPSGVREATLLNERLAALGGKADPRSLLAGWMKDPYQPDFQGPSLRSESDDEKYDARFPDHALTRARRTLRQLRRSVQINRALLKVARPFPRDAS